MSQPEPVEGRPKPSSRRTSNQQLATSDKAVAAAARASLRIELRETEDEVADRERLEELLAALRDFPGADEVRLAVHTLDGATHPIVLGKLRVRACEELVERLAAVLSEAGEAEVGEG